MAHFSPQDPAGVPLEDKHGEVLLQVCDLHLCTVANHNGDPNLQYLNVTVNKGDVYHQGKCVTFTSVPWPVTMETPIYSISMLQLTREMSTIKVSV